MGKARTTVAEGEAAPAQRQSLARGRYHHGSLHQALIDATEDILAEHGIEGFTLREAARRAGVSAAAPAHHFGSATGLLTEVALLGFEELTRDLKEANARGGKDVAARLREQGVAYVRFALSHPGLFQLMFRATRLKAQDERLHLAGRAAMGELKSAIGDYFRQAGRRPSERTTLATTLAAWSAAHGFAQLALEGKFDTEAGAMGAGAFVEDLAPDVFAVLWPSAQPARRKRAGE
ncbi:MAG: TetR/AcrR family transcriptional regulator [Alphaproteobacteria bacterium]|nr:TetR/AcrR family transcriptional regulator [Alphaproteobacteria bacterium]MCW5739884.1 TetR/AcrR family transcriptional regulator [Alphaproteobacteria bacterium]